MGDVVSMFPSTDVPSVLRSIADGIDDGTYEDCDCTLVIGARVFHIGTIDDQQAAMEAIWNLTRGIHKLQFQVDIHESGLLDE